jgi:hypothetical protein
MHLCLLIHQVRLFSNFCIMISGVLWSLPYTSQPNVCATEHTVEITANVKVKLY